jgi:tripartite-type tricarboxylate transporter receptor subunit TctC
MVPSGTPNAIVDRIYSEVANVLKQADTTEKVREQGFDVVANSPDEAQKFMAAEVERWGKLVREANIKPD